MPAKHWKIRAIGQKALWNLPGGVWLNTWASLLRGGHRPEHEFPEKHAGNFFRHLHALQGCGMKSTNGLNVLEIGTGWDLNIALLFSLCGFGRIMTIDVYRHVRLKQVKRYLPMFSTVIRDVASISGRNENEIRTQLETFSRSSSLEELCTLARIRYVAPISDNYSEIADDSLDLCYSTAVFEHIRPELIRRILEMTHKKMKPNGLSTHIIDLKDHFAYFQRGLYYNNFLRFSERQWNRWAGNPLSYTNRLLSSHWRSMFTDTGYDLLQFEEIEEKKLPPIPFALIHASNQSISQHDLRIGELHVIARPRK
jgi:hypothetical protein